MDELKNASLEGKSWIAQLEEKEKARTGIGSLKVRYTSVFGYYIEVSKANLDKVPSDYHRKQTLVNAERFITPELKEMEGKVLGAQDKANRLEYEIFDGIRSEVAKELSRLQRVARIIAELDVFSGMATVADRGRIVRPEVDDSTEMAIVDGRHPVLDRLLSSDQFVPNDTHLGVEGVEIIVLTGPNMAGKSTYIRQVALLTLMAQVGFFVPGQGNEIGRRGPHLLPGGGLRRPDPGPKHLHGGNGGDRQYPQPRHRQEPPDPGRGGAGHLHLRRGFHRLGGGGIPRPKDQGPHPLRHPLPRIDPSVGRLPRREELQYRGAGNGTTRCSSFARSWKGGPTRATASKWPAWRGFPSPSWKGPRRS